MDPRLTPTEFINTVCAQVRFKPDRPGIARELSAHLEDRAEMLMAHGFDEDTARSRAVAAMGDPEEIGRELDKEHSPFWGWTAKISGLLLCLAAITLVICLTVSGMMYDHRGEILDCGFFFWREQNYAGEILCWEPLAVWCETERFRVLLTKLKITDGEGNAPIAVQVDTVWIYKNPLLNHADEASGLTISFHDGLGELPYFMEWGDLHRNGELPTTLYLELTTDLGEHRTVGVPVQWRVSDEKTE